MMIEVNFSNLEKVFSEEVQKFDFEERPEIIEISKKYDEASKYCLEAKNARIEGNYDKLYSLASNFLEKYPGNIVANLDLAEAFSKKGNILMACEVLDRLSKLYPSNEFFFAGQKNLFFIENLEASNGSKMDFSILN